MSSSQVFTAFQGGQGAALAAVVLFAIISLAAVDFVWLRMLVVGVNQLLGRGSMQAIKRERAIFHSQLGAYMASLLLSNLLSSIAIIINATWVSQGGITTGGLCTSQATLSQIADVAGAYFTGAIAVHTFTSLVLKYRLPLWVVSGLVLGGWAIAIILAIFPIGTQTRLGPFYTVNGLTCDISPQYPLFETVIHLVPIFIAAIVAAIFYSLVFLILRGTIAIHGGLKLNLDYEARRSTMYDNHEYPRFIAAIARSMLWYPVAYVVLMFPHLITCLLHASGFKVSDTGRVVTAATSSLLGLANVLIFYNIIRIMGPAFDGTGSKASSEKSIGEKSFITNPSPVDVAPPVAAIRAPARAFPPPRSIVSERSFETFGSGHTRQASSISSAGGDSTRRLLPAAHLRQGRFDSPASHEIGRSITPVSELNEMITNGSDRAVPRLIVNVPDHQNSLPAPRRNGRSPVVRNPSVISPIHPSAMMAVPLTGRKTPGSPESAYPASQRNSFINMYASNDQVPAMPTFAFNSPGYSSSSPASDGEESDVPRSAFSQRIPIPAVTPRPTRSKPKSLKSEMLDRLSTIDSPEESGGLSSIAWASLVANAAASNGGVRSAKDIPFAYTEKDYDTKSSRRRSRSVDSWIRRESVVRPESEVGDVPSMLRPGKSLTARTPSSARLPRSGSSTPTSSRGLPAQPRSAIPRYGFATNERVREGPSRVPTYKTFGSND